MVKIRRALLSVSDKTGVVGFARSLELMGVEILSTGGTSALLKKEGVSVNLVEKEIDFPEILSGRVKTLHPKVHGAILAIRDDEKHVKDMKDHDIKPIDLVCVNLYPFKQRTKGGALALEEAVEEIDIGGVCLLRAAAKNFKYVAVVSNVDSYNDIVSEMQANDGALSEDTLARLSYEAFQHTSSYDEAIFSYLKKKITDKDESEMPQSVHMKLELNRTLRYGENPHQKAGLYKSWEDCGLFCAKQHNGKELSYNNIMDVESAYEMALDFSEPTAAIVKHGNPCGVAVAADLKAAFVDAFACDSLSSFGGIVGFNRKVDAALARHMIDSVFLECVIAPAFDEEAIEIFREKKNLRILELPAEKFKSDFGYVIKGINGGALLQQIDSVGDEDFKELTIPTKTEPTKEQLESLRFGWRVSRFVRSNAIVLTSGLKTVGIGAGQMSRVDSVLISIRKAGNKANGASLASDAFFPMPDNIEAAAKAGITNIIQPGGSIRDKDVIEACDKHGIAMVFTGRRHFKH